MQSKSALAAARSNTPSRCPSIPTDSRLSVRPDAHATSLCTLSHGGIMRRVRPQAMLSSKLHAKLHAPRFRLHLQLRPCVLKGSQSRSCLLLIRSQPRPRGWLRLLASATQKASTMAAHSLLLLGVSSGERPATSSRGLPPEPPESPEPPDPPRAPAAE